MEITVHGRHVELPDPLRSSAARKVDRLGRYLTGMERADVLFSDGNGPGAPVSCDLTIEGHGHVVRASARAKDPAAALEAAVDRAGEQLRKLKKKLVDRSRPHHAKPGALETVAVTTSGDGPDEALLDEADEEGTAEP